MGDNGAHDSASFLDDQEDPLGERDASGSATADTQVYERYVLIRVDTTSTNATADNRPGAGRALDQLYQRGGRRIEHAVGAIAKRIIEHRQPTTNANAQNQIISLPRVDTISTNATEDDRPGPGRGLGKLYDMGGKKVERMLGNFSERIGLGPMAAARRFVATVDRLGTGGYSSKPLFGYMKWQTYTIQRIGRMEVEVARSFGRLVKYTQSKTILTQLQALSLLIKLKIRHPVRVHMLCTEYGVREILRLLYCFSRTEGTVIQTWYTSSVTSGDLDALLAYSHKALICVEENELNSVAKELFEVLTFSPESQESQVMATTIKRLIRFLQNEDYANLASEYLLSTNLSVTLEILNGSDAGEHALTCCLALLQSLRKLSCPAFYCANHCTAHMHNSNLSQVNSAECSQLRSVDLYLHLLSRRAGHDEQLSYAVGASESLDITRIITRRNVLALFHECTGSLLDQLVAEYYGKYIRSRKPLSAFRRNFEEVSKAEVSNSLVPTLDGEAFKNVLESTYRSVENEMMAVYMYHTGQLIFKRDANIPPCDQCKIVGSCAHYTFANPTVGHPELVATEYMLRSDEGIRRFRELAS